jgi:hypothetical protein
MVEEAVEIIESEDEDAKGCKKRATLGQRSSADILREVLELLEAAVAVDNGAVAAFAYGLATKLMERLESVEPPGQGRDIEGCRTDPVPRASRQLPTPAAAPPPACAASPPQSPPGSPAGNGKRDPKEVLSAARAKLVERERP